MIQQYFLLTKIQNDRPKSYDHLNKLQKQYQTDSLLEKGRGLTRELHTACNLLEIEENKYL